MFEKNQRKDSKKTESATPNPLPQKRLPGGRCPTRLVIVHVRFIIMKCFNHLSPDAQQLLLIGAMLFAIALPFVIERLAVPAPLSVPLHVTSPFR